MSKKTMIRIDEDKCIGCGKCVNACQGGALELINGKAKLTREDYCDGLGRCIGQCPVDAITFEEVDVVKTKPQPAAAPSTHSGCPGMAAKQFVKKESVAEGASALGSWPIQLHLIRPEAPQFQNADILIAASCTAFSYGSFHSRLLQGRGLVIACPKLDRQEGYAEKLEEFFSSAEPRSVTVARMEVPCCSGLSNMVVRARDKAGSNIIINEVIISLQGEEKSVNQL